MCAALVWFEEPIGPVCPECGSDNPPRLVTFAGVDHGTGERVYEERFQCACGFAGEAREFEFAGAISRRGERGGGNLRDTASAKPRRAAGANDAGASKAVSPRVDRGNNTDVCPF